MVLLRDDSCILVSEFTPWGWWTEEWMLHSWIHEHFQSDIHVMSPDLYESGNNVCGPEIINPRKKYVFIFHLRFEGGGLASCKMYKYTCLNYQQTISLIPAAVGSYREIAVSSNELWFHWYINLFLDIHILIFTLYLAWLTEKAGIRNVSIQVAHVTRVYKTI